MKKGKELIVLNELEGYVKGVYYNGEIYEISIKNHIKGVLKGVIREEEKLCIELGYVIYKNNRERVEGLKRDITERVRKLTFKEWEEVEIQSVEGTRYTLGGYIEKLCKEEKELVNEIGELVTIGMLKGQYEEQEESKVMDIYIKRGYPLFFIMYK